MTIVMDPAGSEIRALRRLLEWRRRSILEIGCGEGRLTLRLAAFSPAHIEAIDPDAARLREARTSLPRRYRSRISYHLGYAESLKYPRDQFDLAVFSWSL